MPLFSEMVKFFKIFIFASSLSFALNNKADSTIMAGVRAFMIMILVNLLKS